MLGDFLSKSSGTLMIGGCSSSAFGALLQSSRWGRHPCVILFWHDACSFGSPRAAREAGAYLSSWTKYLTRLPTMGVRACFTRADISTTIQFIILFVECNRKNTAMKMRRN